MSSFKKAVKDFEEGKVLFYYKEDGKVIEVISINKYGKNDFGYWMVDVRPKDVDFDNIEDSLFQLLYHDYDYCDQGFSCRSTLKDVVEDTIVYVPTFKQDIKELDSEMTVF